MFQCIRHLKSMLSMIGLVLLMASPAAQAVPSDQTFYWSANCEDCATFAGQPGPYGVTAVLSLTNYELGTPITMNNFQSFSYSGSNLVFPFFVGGNITDRSGGLWSVGTVYEEGLVGQINSVPAANRFEIQFDDGLFFQTQSDGAWSTCAPGIRTLTATAGYYGGGSCFTFPAASADFGQTAVFTTTPVPEPGAWAMLAAGLAVVGFMRRRSKLAA